MARTGVAFETVAEAAKTIQSEGREPTWRAVRELIGSGSPNTIHRHILEWLTLANKTIEKAPVLPDSLQKMLANVIAEACNSAKSKAEAELTKALDDLSSLTNYGESVEAERDALADQVASLITERDQVVATATERAAEIERLGNTVLREQQAAESARIEHAKIEQSLAAVKAHLVQANERNDKLDGELKEVRQAFQFAQQEAASSAAKLDAAQQRIEDLKRDMEAANKSKSELAAEIDKVKSNLLECAKARQVAEQDAAVSKAQQQATEQRNGELKADLEDVRQELREVRLVKPDEKNFEG